ncbi:TetR/AcrR family transcriptional regulator [Nocardia xishanensis]
MQHEAIRYDIDGFISGGQRFGDPGRPRTRLSAADRRASIIDAATQAFAESGYQRATMGQIATRLGVTEPVVFHNFGSKPGSTPPSWHMPPARWPR